MKQSRLPKSFKPELATLVSKPFSDPGWLFEMKLDGIRALARKKGDKVFLFSRNGNSLNRAFPEIVSAIENIKKDGFIFDGEIVAGKGKLGSFSELQSRIHRKSYKDEEKKAQVTYFIFDLPYFEGTNLQNLSLIERKKLLYKSFHLRKPLFYTEHRIKNGTTLFKSLLKRGYEGVIAKRANSKYHQRRTRDWLKFKGIEDDEFIIVGYTKPKGSRSKLGALLLASKRGKKLHYAGRVGTGFSERMLHELYKKLSEITTDKAHFSDMKATWVRPILKCKVGFTEKTKDSKLRHPRFLGLV